MKRYVLNSPVLTAYGLFRFERIDAAAAKTFLAQGFTSAVGHAGAAHFLHAILGVEMGVQRISIEMAVGDQALILRLLGRLTEGAVLTLEQMAAFPYELGMLTRLE